MSENSTCNKEIRGSYVQELNLESNAWFIRRISALSNAIETIDNEMIWVIIFCLNCTRHGRNATYEQDLKR